MNVSFHIRKAVIELEMAKHEVMRATEKQEIQEIIESVIKLKCGKKVNK